MRVFRYFRISLLIAGLCLTNTISIRGQQPEAIESSSALVSTTTLKNALSDELQQIRISPDGKYALAQDDDFINIFSVKPFAFLFSIPASDVSAAQFTSNSQGVAFYTRDLRIHLWNLAGEKETATWPLSLKENCLQTLLSPDAQVFACLSENNDLILIEVATAKPILRAQRFYRESEWTGDISLNSNMLKEELMNMKFSPDSKYFVAGSRTLKTREFMEYEATVAAANRTGNPLEYRANNVTSGANRPDRLVEEHVNEVSQATAFELSTKKQVSLGSDLKDVIAGDFAFVGTDRIVGTNAKTLRSVLTVFPQGAALKQLTLKGRVAAAAHGDYVLVRPLNDLPVGVVSLATNTVLFRNKLAALDVYDDFYIAERNDGELGLYGIAKNDLLGSARLPKRYLHKLKALALSSDLKWMAMSGESRGGIWNMNTGERASLTRRFEGAFFATGKGFYVDFPKSGNVERTIALLRPDENDTRAVHQIADSTKETTEQYGEYVLSLAYRDRNSPPDENEVLQVKDLIMMKPIWSQTFPKEGPSIWMDAGNAVIALEWSAASEAAKSEIKNDPGLRTSFSRMKAKENGYFVKLLDARTGETQARLLIEGDETSFMANILGVGDRVVTVDSRKRVRIYSLPNGQITATLTGEQAAVSKAAGMLCVSENRSLTIYDVATMKAWPLTLSNPVLSARFTEDGKKLVVVTLNQTVYVLDVTRLSLN